MKLTKPSVVSLRNYNISSGHFFNQAGYITSMSKSVCAYEFTQCDVLDMSRINLVEFSFLLYYCFCCDIPLQANSQVLESMDQRSLFCSFHVRYSYGCCQHCISSFDPGSTAICHLESANVIKEKTRSFYDFSGWHFVSSQNSVFSSYMTYKGIQSVYSISYSIVLFHQAS